MVVKLERVDGSKYFTFCHVYEEYDTKTGIIEVPDNLVSIACGTGLYQIVAEPVKPAPVKKNEKPVVKEADNGR